MNTFNEPGFTYGDIPTTFQQLMDQASMTSDTYFAKARRTLDASGLKYTAADVVALAAVSAQDLHTAMLTGTLSGISNALNRMSLQYPDEAFPS